jgi:anti-sigma factor RsiW
MQEVRIKMKKIEMNNKMNCRKIESSLPDLLLDPESVKPSVREHLAACPACQSELAGLQATMSALDAWTAPDPSPYFDVRMQARLRAAKEAEPEGFWERLRARMLFSSNFHLRTASAAALATVLAIGGGSAIYVAQQPATPAVQASATVRDLQSLDENAQVFQQLNSVDTDDSDSGSSN